MAMKAIVFYYSFTNNNKLLAAEIQRLLGCDVFKIEPVRKRTGFSIFLDVVFNRTPEVNAPPSNLGEYNLCIFVGPVWAGKIAAPLRAFLRKTAPAVTRYAFVTVCGGGNPQQANKISNELKSILGCEAVGVCELWVSDLVSEENRNKISTVSGYRIDRRDLMIFQQRLATFLRGLHANASAPAA